MNVKFPDSNLACPAESSTLMIYPIPIAAYMYKQKHPEVVLFAFMYTRWRLKIENLARQICTNSFFCAQIRAQSNQDKY